MGGKAWSWTKRKLTAAAAGATAGVVQIGYINTVFPHFFENTLASSTYYSLFKSVQLQAIVNIINKVINKQYNEIYIKSITALLTALSEIMEFFKTEILFSSHEIDQAQRYHDAGEPHEPWSTFAPAHYKLINDELIKLILKIVDLLNILIKPKNCKPWCSIKRTGSGGKSTKKSTKKKAPKKKHQKKSTKKKAPKKKHQKKSNKKKHQKKSTKKSKKV